MRIGLVIFDFDGTLADSYPWFLGALGPLARRHGLRQVDAAEAEALRHRGTRDILAQLGVPPWKLPAITRDLRAMKAAAAADIPLFPGVADLLRDLAAAGQPVAIVSSDAEANIRRTLGPLVATIRHFGCGAGLFGKAPKLRAALRAAGVAPAAALAIGDDTRDAEAAATVGIPFGAVAWGYAAPAVLAAVNPAHAFGSVAELRRVLLG